MFDENHLPLFLKMPVLPLAFVFILTIAVAYGIAWGYRNDYDGLKMLKTGL